MNTLCTITRLIALALLASACAAQVIQLNAGSSDMYRSNGGSIDVSGLGFTSGVGVGSVSGEIRIGAYLKRDFHDYCVIAGDQSSQIDLPTDIFSGGQQLDLRGGSVGRKTDSTELYVFGGLKSFTYGAPYFHAADGNDSVGVVLFSHRLNDRWTFYSRNVFSDQQTSIQALEFRPATWLKLAGSGGIGSNQPYGAVSANATLDTLTVRAAYIVQSDLFRRAIWDGAVMSEPTGGNLAVAWQPTRRVSVNYSHMNLNSALYDNRVLPAANMDQAGATWNSRWLQAAGNFYTSSSKDATGADVRTNALSMSAGRKITTWSEVNINWLQSKASTMSQSTKSLIATIRETVSPRLELMQFVTHSGGNTTLSFGGNLVGNRLSIGLEYQTIYVPYNPSKPFQQAAVVNIRLRPFGSLTLNGGTSVGADGHLRYTAWANQTIVRAEGLQMHQPDMTMSMPRYIIRGQVTDEHSKPVKGAAIKIGKEVLYSDDNGQFFWRTSKRGTFSFGVLVDEFLVPGFWESVVVPNTVQSETEDRAPNLEVVVKRISKEESRKREEQKREAQLQKRNQPQDDGETMK